MAAKISAYESVLNPYDTLDVNINVTLNVLEAYSNNQVKNFVLAAVYGEPQKLPISEDHPLDDLLCMNVDIRPSILHNIDSKSDLTIISLTQFKFESESTTREALVSY